MIQARSMSEGLPPDAGAGSPRLQRIAADFFLAHCRDVWTRTDRMFAGLLVLEWLAGIALALWITPRTWIGATSSLHLHVDAAIFLGAIIISFPLVLVFLRSGTALTRHTIAVAQMLDSALLIDLTGGRIESHFHIFGSLAFLAFYRDWRVLVTASAVVALDHFVRGIFWPESIFGTLTPDYFRWLEHTGWVVFEDIFLFIMCRESIREMRSIACRQAESELTHERIERAVEERTRELNDSNHELLRAKSATDRANQALRLDNFILENVDEGIYLVRARDGTIVHANPKFDSLFGYAPGEIVGQHESGLNAAIDRLPEETAREINAALRKDGAWQGEIQSVRKDGHPFWCSARVKIFQHADHGPVWVATRQDISERKRAEQQIAEQAAFLDKARDAIVARDLEGKILFWNEGAEAIYGWKRAEAIGRNVGELIYADPARFRDVARETLEREEWSGELQHRTKDRKEIVIDERCTIIRDAQGRPKSILAIKTDITEKKKLEAQFMRAQRMESIGTLAGGIAHDLNNILAPIMMSIDILKSSQQDPQAAMILDTVETSARRGADIVRQVLSFARGVEGERVIIQPKHLLKELAGMIKQTFPKDVHLQFNVTDKAWTILGDPTQIHQILLNLCVNARDAMPNGGKLTVSLENAILDEHYAAMNLEARAGHYVKISVTDSGVGMPPEIQEKIFEPFFTTKELSKGTGLGLSTVLAIVKSHHGLINVYSEVGNGTTFHVYLPVTGDTEEAVPHPTVSNSRPRGNDELILLIDDEISILTITGQTLQAYGYRVLTATNGADALVIYARRKSEIAAVVTDMTMPLLDGPATIHALLKINPAVRIIAASGLHANGRVSNAPKTGTQSLLAKPYSSGTLLQALRKVIDQPARHSS